MPKKYIPSRRERFIDIDGRDAFMPLSRMVEIRRDEAIIRSRLKREEGITDVTFRHVHFHCPTGCCLGTAIPQIPKK